MGKYNKTAITIILMLIASSSTLLSQDTIIDTVFSIPWLDGGITYSPGLGMYGLSTIYGNEIVGDYYSAILWGYFFNRAFCNIYYNR